MPSFENTLFSKSFSTSAYTKFGNTIKYALREAPSLLFAAIIKFPSLSSSIHNQFLKPVSNLKLHSSFQPVSGPIVDVYSTQT